MRWILMIKSWSDAAWEDFEYWMKQDNMIKIVQCDFHYRDK